jgi:hypothetical protein
MQKTFNVKNLSQNSTNDLLENGFHCSLIHLPEDPANANRLRISYEGTIVELLPSKGFSLSQVWIKGKPIFWEAPINLPDTETLDLWSDEVCINGVQAKGFTFLKTLVAGIELYGLKNWGMPVEKDGRLQLLHGETSNIPIDDVSLDIEKETCTISSSFIYHSFEGHIEKPWYKRGEALYKVSRKLTLTKGNFEIKLEDTIENISNHNLSPDWGYHITFRPEEGTKLIVPSRKTEVRGGGLLPENYNIWSAGNDISKRTETGIIYKELLIDIGGNKTETVIQYPDGSAVKVSVPPVPYFQSWMCSGGKGSKEFTFKNGESLLHKHWDGIGIEIGSSALDHDGNTDKSVEYMQELAPGEKKTIGICVKRVI